MKHKLDFVDTQLEKIKKENLHRKLKNEKINGAYITINKKKVLNLCSNDYLGLPVTKIKQNQIQSSSRLVSGNDSIFEILEKKLARHKSHQAGLIFPTGYMANLGSIGTLIQKGDLILSDELNHASIIESCKLTGAKISVYKHNDIKDLKSKLAQKFKRKFVITEGIFSMDGDYARLKEISEIADKTNAITILDDSHGDFVVGNDGKGTANHFGVTKKIDVYTSSLSKGLGSFGGYITSQKNVIDLCINKSKSFIYTSALPSAIVEHALNRFLAKRETRRKKLEKNVKYLITGLEQIGYHITSKSHIIPIIVGKEKMALEFGKYLLDKGVFAQPIRYPTVPQGKARIRVSVTAWLSQNNIDQVLSVFESAKKRFDVI